MHLTRIGDGFFARLRVTRLVTAPSTTVSPTTGSSTVIRHIIYVLPKNRIAFVSAGENICLIDPFRPKQYLKNPYLRLFFRFIQF
jgi:hypothetical protein